MIFIEESDDRFYVETSTLPNAGLGCFAKVPIKNGDWLEIIGVYVRKGGIADRCTSYAQRYKFAGSPKMDAKIVPMGFGGMVNHSSDPNQQNAVLEYYPGLNKRSEHTGQMIYRMLRDIEPGEEVIGNYGGQLGPEVERMATNASYLNTEADEWNKFLNHNLYGLKELINSL